MRIPRLLTFLTGPPSGSVEVPSGPPPSALSSDILRLLMEDKALQLVAGDRNSHTLGTPREVRERIAEILPGVTFDDDGRGSFTRTGYALSFATGHGEQVGAVDLRVSGGPAAMPPLQRLLTKTGWRLVEAGDR